MRARVRAPALQSAGARCLAQLGEAAQGLVQRCLEARGDGRAPGRRQWPSAVLYLKTLSSEALPLPAPAVEPQGPSDTLQRWEQLVCVPSRLIPPSHTTMSDLMSRH